MNTIFEQGEFTDYLGQAHKFTVAGIVIEKPNTDIRHYTYQGPWCYSELVSEISKVISIGISICNPLDEYNDHRGELQAEGRAKKFAFVNGNPNQRIIAVNKSGMVSPEVVDFFVHQTAEALKKNPGLFIKGYNGAAKKCFNKTIK